MTDLSGGVAVVLPCVCIDLGEFLCQVRGHVCQVLSYITCC
jgi:hypothetical protein